MAFARQTWQLNPGIAIYLTERFSVPALESEVTRLVRSNPLACVDVPDALNFLVGDRLDPNVRRDLRVRSGFTYLLGILLNLDQHLVLWSLVPPVTAISFFERRYRNDPLILQYAHRVLEQHHVSITFFFVPQVVQALRYDDLGAFLMSTFLMSKHKRSSPQAMSPISSLRPPRYRSCFATRSFGT